MEGNMRRGKRFHSKLIVCLFCVVILLVACSGLKELAETAKVERPEVEIVGSKLTGLSFRDIDFMFDVRIQNPNSLGVKLSGFDYDFLINENSFINGDQEEGMEIKAQGEHTVHLPVSFEFSSLYQAFQSLRQNDNSTYELKCGFSFELPILGPVRIPVSTKGDVPLIKFPKVNLDGLKLKHLGFSGADLELAVRFDNPNAFSMILERFNYQLNINGQSWASGDVEQRTEVADKGEGVLAIPISLDFAQIGRSVYGMLTGDQSFDYQLQGDLDLSSSFPLLEKATLPFDLTGVTELIK